MYVLVNVKDNKANFLVELVNNFSFARAKPISKSKALLLNDIKESVINLNLVKQGKLEAKPLNELLDEL